MSSSAGIELPYFSRNVALANKGAREVVKGLCKRAGERIAVCGALFLAAALCAFSPSQAAAETRSLKLYYIHTQEKAVITFKRGDKYDQKGLQEMNRFLRDWRRNQPTRMDPRLFDLVWEVYRRSGATDYINVVSAFRSPETNGMLRSRSQGVAKNSQHMLGKAMDFFIPGVKLARLREIGMQMQIGGVGFYPTSGSPFVHLDVGSVRAWPRMSRQELVRLFPNGNTIHLPADGTPLPGYEVAMADYKRRVGATSVQAAGDAPSSSSGRPRTLLAALFGSDEEEDSEEAGAPEPAPADDSPPTARARAVREAAVAAAAPPAGVATAPLPGVRPSFGNEGASTALASALYSPARNAAAQDALQAATTPLAAPAKQQQFADLAQYAVPVPTLLGERRMKGDAQDAVLTASTGGVTDAALSAAVPVPANRPAVAEASLVTTGGNAQKQPEAARQQEPALSPLVVASLEQGGRGSAIPSLAAPTAAAFPHADRPAKAAAAKTGFGDAFEVTPVIESGLAAGLPTKGGRPTKTDAAVSHQAMVGGARLTQDSIADWALSQNKGVTLRAVKAPRFANRMLSPEIAASASFRPGAAAIDSSRFSTPVRMP